MFGWFQRTDAPSRPVDPLRPRSALGLVKGLPETARYFDADDALYNYESPFYRYCASGFPLIFADRDYRAEFDAKRRRLERERREAWDAACNATVRHQRAASAGVTRTGRDSEAGSVGEADSTRSAEGGDAQPSSAKSDRAVRSLIEDIG